MFAEKVAAPSADTVPVAVVISGRNYANYLGDCIESVQRQDPRPKEIIYMDNASTDGSVQLAREKGIKVGVISTREQNICTCRNRGALATKQPYLLFLDADDIIPPNYLKPLLNVMREGRTGVAFPHMTQFGLYNSQGHNPKGWGRPKMLRENYVPGQSLVRRIALDSVGGWGDMPVFQDWELWLRIGAQGWLFKYVPGVTYEHRTHANSLTSSFRERIPYYQEVLRRQPLTLFTPFGPRCPIIGKNYFRFIERLGLVWDRVTLLFYDNSNDAATHDLLKGYLKDSPARGNIYYRDDTRVSYTNLVERVQVMPERMAEIWMRASEMFTGDFVFSIEDDNEPYDDGVGHRIYEGFAPDVDAVCCPYHSRPLVDSNVLLAREWVTTRSGALGVRNIHRHPGGLPHPPKDGCTQIGASGVGFTVIRKDVLNNFQYPTGILGQWVGQDFGLWRHVKDRGMRLMCHWGCRVKHWYSATEYT